VTNSVKKLHLGLQGGGSYGAFGWGVLDRLLEDGRFEIAAISGSSGGAINAAVMLDGYAQGGGREGARLALQRFWNTLGAMSIFSPLRRAPADYLAGQGSMQASPAYHLLQVMSAALPPQLTPVSINPLVSLLASMIDFERVRSCDAMRLYVTATNVRTGKGKLFRREELDARKLAASACLPQVFAGIEVDGESYWDGGFVGNPALAPLASDGGAGDILIVQNNPIARDRLPLSVADIGNRASEIAFNIGFVREISAIRHMGLLMDEEQPELTHPAAVRLHLVTGNGELQNLDISSKFNNELPFIQHLFAVGRQATDDWLAAHADQVGLQSTLDARAIFYPETMTDAPG
jgi:NTE family protein